MIEFPMRRWCSADATSRPVSPSLRLQEALRTQGRPMNPDLVSLIGIWGESTRAEGYHWLLHRDSAKRDTIVSRARRGEKIRRRQKGHLRKKAEHLRVWGGLEELGAGIGCNDDGDDGDDGEGPGFCGFLYLVVNFCWLFCVWHPERDIMDIEGIVTLPSTSLVRTLLSDVQLIRQGLPVLSPKEPSNLECAESQANRTLKTQSMSQNGLPKYPASPRFPGSHQGTEQHSLIILGIYKAMMAGYVLRVMNVSCVVTHKGQAPHLGQRHRRREDRNHGQGPNRRKRIEAFEGSPSHVSLGWGTGTSVRTPSHFCDRSRAKGIAQLRPRRFHAHLRAKSMMRASDLIAITAIAGYLRAEDERPVGDWSAWHLQTRGSDRLTPKCGGCISD
ncbi:hypothetical protein DFH94DRAFT_679776 [Russula ochroleuca]|uniref:Uncharacterized protein n=1 Tax=Russula ochroleuca TaxID=152965 RepID=A0A9P5N390_9AGAM|nr:hypothetical protein DFH94DRAFT_679776 [Russula ochroleuca]